MKNHKRKNKTSKLKNHPLVFAAKDDKEAKENRKSYFLTMQFAELIPGEFDSGLKHARIAAIQAASEQGRPSFVLKRPVKRNAKRRNRLRTWIQKQARKISRPTY
jgi:hypothetical protein